MAASTGNNPTFSITADAKQALATFDEVAAAAYKAQRKAAAGTAGNSAKFTTGIKGEQRRELEAYINDLDRLAKAAARLKSGQLIPKDFFEGFKGGTVAQATQFRGVQGQRNIASNVAQRAAEAGTKVPAELIQRLTSGFATAGNKYAQDLLKDLQRALPGQVQSALGSSNQIQLGSVGKTIVQYAEGVLNEIKQIMAQTNKTLQEARVLAQKQNADLRAQARAAADTAATSTRMPLPPAATGSGAGGSGSGSGGGGAGTGASPLPPPVPPGQTPGVRGGPLLTSREGSPEKTNAAILQDAYAQQQRILNQELRAAHEEAIKNDQLFNQRRLEAARASARAGVVDVKGGRTVQFDEQTGRPRVSVGTSEGARILDPSKAPATVRAAVSEAYAQLATQAGKELNDAVRAGRRIPTGQSPGLPGGPFLSDRTQSSGDRESQDRILQAAYAQDAKLTAKAVGEAHAQAIKQDQLFNQQRVETARASARTEVVDVSRGRTVQFDRQTGQPRVTAPTPDGSRVLDPNKAPVAVRTAVEEAFRQLAANARKELLDAAKAINGEGFVQLGNNFFADIRNKQRTIYEITEKGYEALQQGAKNLAAKLAELDKIVRTIPTPFINAGDNVPRLRPQPVTPDERDRRVQQGAANENTRRDNIGRLTNIDTGGLQSGVVKAGAYLADLRGPTVELYRDFIKLSQGTKEYAQGQQRLFETLSRRGTGTIGSAIYSGLASSGFGGGGGEGGEFGLIGGLVRSGATTAKYAALGTVLFGLSRAAHQAFSEFLDFDDSLTELSIAFGTTDQAIASNQSYLNHLADSASEAGSNVGEAMDVAASAVRAFGQQTGDTAQKSEKDLQELSVSFAREASRIAILTKTTLTDAAGNLKATTLGFDVPESNFSRVTDALANAKLVGGGDEKQIGQGVANISVAAKEAGFTLEETGNIISDIIAKTDQGGTLVAQRLSRAFSIVGGSAGQNAIRALNAQLPSEKRVDTGAGVKPADQIKQLSAIYGTLSEQQRKTLNNQLGGTANARELIILLEDAQRLTQSSSLEAGGKGAEEYEKRLKNIRAVLTQIQGNVKNLIAALANSGILTLLGVGLDALLNITKAARTVAEAFDAIPSKIRTLAGLLIGVLITMKAIQAVTSAGGLRGYAGRLEQRYAPARALARREIEGQNAALLASARTGPGQGYNSPAGLLRRAEADRVARAARFQRINDIGRTAVPLPASFGSAASAPFRGAAFLGTSAVTSFQNFRQTQAERATAARAAVAAAGGTRALAREAERQARNTTPLGRQTRVIGPEEDGRRPVRYGNTAQGPITPAGLLPGQATGQGTVRGRIGAAATSGRAQLNGAGLFGGIAIAAVGVAAISNAIDAGKKISSAIKEFNKIPQVPDTFGSQELKDSAANLRSAAATLKESSHGFFGTIINTLRGNETGQKAKDALELADIQELDAKKLEASRKKSQKGGISELAGTIDISSDDGLSSSLDSISKSGRNATEIMQAFQERLQGIGTAGEKATRALNGFEADTVAAGVSEKAVQRFNLLKPVDGSLAASSFAVAHPTLAALDSGREFQYKIPGLKNLVPDDEAKALDRSKNLLGIDTKKVNSVTSDIVTSFLKGGGDVNNKASLETLRSSLAAGYKDKVGILDPTVVSDLASGAILDVVSQYKSVTSVTDDTASFANLAAAIPGLAASAGKEAAVTNARFGNPNNISDDLLSGQTELKQLQDGYDTLLSKTDGSKEDQNQLHALQASIEAKKVEIADATVENLQSLFAINQASKPSENTTQRIQDQLAEYTTELATPNLKIGTKRQLLIAQAAAKQQLALSQIGDRFGTARARIDSRDTIGVDKNARDRIAAELEDFKKRGVIGKALADKQIELNDAKRKVFEDQGALDVATKVAGLSSNSAVDQATAAVIQATQAVKDALPGTAAYVAAQKAKIDAIKQQAQADLDAAHLQRQLNIDLSNPVQTAQEAERTAKDALKQAKSDKEPADVIAQKTLDVRNAQLQSESAAFSQFLSNVQSAEQLGDISHKAYLNLLQGRLTQLQTELRGLDPKSNGYEQIRQQILQLRTAIKSGADELNGMFNLGDIRIPTQYEVRRAIKSSDIGQVLSQNSSGSTAGNVVNDGSTRYVIMNGVSIQQVQTIIQDLFGVKVKTGKTRL